MTAVPVIAIDGPSASGKGTVAEAVAARLGFHYLDSGALYRLTALAALRREVPLDDEAALSEVARDLSPRFAERRIWLDGDDVSLELRSEQCAEAASRVAVLPRVRTALLERQRAFRQPPGLVADGRDMGSVVFPDARLKIYLTASAEVRAERRYKQLIEKGLCANLEDLLQEIRNRDMRDANRSVAPLELIPGAKLLDTSQMSIDAAVAQVLAWYDALDQQAK